MCIRDSHSLVQFDDEIREDVHVVDESVVGRIVGVEIGVYVTVREPFGSHVVEMVGGLHETPHIVEVGAFQCRDLLLLSLIHI